MRTVDAWKGPMGVSALALLAALAMASGCTEKKSVEADAEVPPADAGLDATGGNGTDAQVPPDAQDAATGSYFCARDGGDAPSDGGAEDSPAACTPAACEAPDGGVDGDRPPWGCPEACDPPCEGDTVCCDDGTCERRSLHECDCDEGCDVEATVGFAILCVNNCPGGAMADVCNRGVSSDIPPGQVVRFEVEDELICETTTSEAIPPCECMRVTCVGPESGCHEILGSNELRTTINPDGPDPECGSPLGNTRGGGMVVYCD
jgi:hypothetical protein